DIRERAIFGAAAASNLGLLKELHKEGVELDIVQGRATLTHTAAQHGNLAIVEYLFHEGVDVIQTYAERTPLYAAATCDKLAVSRFLLGHGAKVTDEVVRTTILHQRSDVLKCLIDHAPHLTCGIHLDGTLVMQDVYEPLSDPSQRARFIEVVVSKFGVNVNAAGNSGATMLHIAVSKHDLPIAKLLVGLGARTNVEDHSGRTPIELAVCGGKSDIVAWLGRHEAAQSTFSIENEKKLALEIMRPFNVSAIKRAAIHSPGRTLEARLASGEAKWIFTGIDLKLGNEWVKCLLVNAPEQWHDYIGSEILSAHLELFGIDNEFVAGERVPVASRHNADEAAGVVRVSEKLMPESMPLRQRDQVSLACVQRMKATHLQSLVEFCSSTPGKRVVTGQLRMIVEHRWIPRKNLRP
ncbi:hypothetical protein LTR86_011200, partial [Recurvomyces mirabilis]